jgi:Na+-driven multidrug efflux pump
MYLKGFSLDCLFGSLLLMLLGFFNGMGHSNFVMIQGLVGAFIIRIPVVLAIGTMVNITLSDTLIGVIFSFPYHQKFPTGIKPMRNILYVIFIYPNFSLSGTAAHL